MFYAASKRFFTHSLITILLLCSIQTASAGSLVILDDFQQNCDIQQLKLSDEQNQALRQMRQEYKQASDRAYLKSDKVVRNRRQNIMRALMKETFDENAARDYVESRFLPSMDLAVQDFSIQHKFFQMLTPRQRQTWVNRCLQ